MNDRRLVLSYQTPEFKTDLDCIQADNELASVNASSDSDGNNDVQNVHSNLSKK